jgi:hypothetical protein
LSLKRGEEPTVIGPDTQTAQDMVNLLDTGQGLVISLPPRHTPWGKPPILGIPDGHFYGARYRPEPPDHARHQGLHN